MQRDAGLRFPTLRRPRRRDFGALGLALLCALAACSNEREQVSPPDDPWFRPVDNPSHEFFPLPLFLYTPVSTELVDEAAAAMGNGPLLQLSTSEALRYATDPLRTVRELRPFLIHGLYRTRREFRVSIADRALWVDSIDDPDDDTPVKKQPLVIYIDEVPPDVYVTVGAATRAADETSGRDDGGE